MTDDDVLAEFRAADALLEGHFILSSGLRSPRYLQCARVLMDPARAERLAGLEHVLPPRTAGVRALLEGAQQAGAGIVVGWHSGFDDMESVAGIIAAVGRKRTPVTVGLRRVDPPDLLDSTSVEAWLDTLWLDLDRSIAASLAL